MKIIKIVILICLFNILFSLVRYFKETNAEINVLKKEIKTENIKLKDLIIEKKDLEQEAKNLENIEIVEKIARNKLNMKKEGEQIYRVID